VGDHSDTSSVACLLFSACAGASADAGGYIGHVFVLIRTRLPTERTCVAPIMNGHYTAVHHLGYNPPFYTTAFTV